MSYKIEKRRRAFSAEVIDELLPVPHIHSHVELIYLKKGKSVAVLDNHQYVMQEGDFFIAFPNQLCYLKAVCQKRFPAYLKVGQENKFLN